MAVRSLLVNFFKIDKDIHMNNSINTGVLRLPAVIKLVALSRSTIYLLIQKKAFPNPVQLSQRAVGWRQCDIDEWLESRVITGGKGGV